MDEIGNKFTNLKNELVEVWITSFLVDRFLEFFKPFS